MIARTTRFGLLPIVIVGLLILHLFAADSSPKAKELTFFGWSDQHVETNGDAEHLAPAIEAMNSLPGTAYPENIKGQVAVPAFVFGCGDITEWPTHAAMETYDHLITERLKFPSYDILGNHDEGGKVPSDTMKKWLISRHGALRYTFEHAGVHFLAMFSKYDESLDNPAQPLTQESLNWLRAKLANLDAGTPVIVATHLCFDALTNRDALVDAIGDANVIAILGGHYHKAKVDHYGGQHFVQLPSPAPGSPPEFTVVRITSERIVGVPYNYEQDKWAEEKHKRLNTSIRWPR
ncbi:MAG: metallophosphoesterase family protein [Planctomycetota bacterium]